MGSQERLDRQAGNLAALETAFALLVEHTAMAGSLNKEAFMADLRMLVEQRGVDEDVRLAEERMLRTLAGLQPAG